MKSLSTKQLNILFPHNTQNIDTIEKFDCDIKKSLLMDDTSIYSITPWKEANIISKTIRNFFNYEPIITDACSNIGGNTLSFHLTGHFSTVYSIEINIHTYNMLLNNLNIYNMPINNCIHGDYTKIYKNYKQDVIFLDPPWNDNIDIKLSGITIDNFIIELLEANITNMIVLKLPLNYDIKVDDNKYMKIKQHIIRKVKHVYNIFYIFKNDKILYINN